MLGDVFQAENIVNGWIARLLQLQGKGLAVINNIICPMLSRPLHGCRAGSRPGDSQPGPMGKLRCSRSNATGCVNNQDTLPTVLIRLLCDQEPIKKPFPGCNGGQGQRGSLRKIQTLGLASNNALVYQVKLAIGSGMQPIASIIDGIAWPEECTIRTNRFNDPGNIPSQNAWSALGLSLSSTSF